MLIRPLTAIWGSAVLLLASQGLWAQEAPAKSALRCVRAASRACRLLVYP